MFDTTCYRVHADIAPDIGGAYPWVPTAAKLLLLAGAQIDQQEAEITQLREALKLTQFGFNHVRCPVCAGWGMGTNGETNHIHNGDCPVGKALLSER